MIIDYSTGVDEYALVGRGFINTDVPGEPPNLSRLISTWNKIRKAETFSVSYLLFINENYLCLLYIQYVIIKRDRFDNSPGTLVLMNARLTSTVIVYQKTSFCDLREFFGFELSMYYTCFRDECSIPNSYRTVFKNTTRILKKWSNIIRNVSQNDNKKNHQLSKVFLMPNKCLIFRNK